MSGRREIAIASVVSIAALALEANPTVVGVMLLVYIAFWIRRNARSEDTN